MALDAIRITDATGATVPVAADTDPTTQQLVQVLKLAFGAMDTSPTLIADSDGARLPVSDPKALAELQALATALGQTLTVASPSMLAQLQAAVTALQAIQSASGSGSSASTGTIGAAPPTAATQVGGIDKNGLLAAMVLGQSGAQAIEGQQAKQLVAHFAPNSTVVNPSAGSIGATQTLTWPRFRSANGWMDVLVFNPSVGCAIDLEIGTRDPNVGTPPDTWGERLRVWPGTTSPFGPARLFRAQQPSGTALSFRFRYLDSVSETFSPVAVFYGR